MVKKWALAFLIIAAVAGILGFAGFVVELAADLAKVVFYLFLALFVGSLLLGRRHKV